MSPSGHVGAGHSRLPGSGTLPTSAVSEHGAKPCVDILPLPSPTLTCCYLSPWSAQPCTVSCVLGGWSAQVRSTAILGSDRVEMGRSRVTGSWACMVGASGLGPPGKRAGEQVAVYRCIEGREFSCGPAVESVAGVRTQKPKQEQIIMATLARAARPSICPLGPTTCPLGPTTEPSGSCHLDQGTRPSRK